MKTRVRHPTKNEKRRMTATRWYEFFPPLSEGRRRSHTAPTLVGSVAVGYLQERWETPDAHEHRGTVRPVNSFCQLTL